jgi:hypothetical protein
MALILTEYVLELVLDDDAALPETAIEKNVTRADLDSAAKLVARGGVDGAIQAVNLSMPVGYELRRRPIG